MDRRLLQSTQEAWPQGHHQRSQYQHHHHPAEIGDLQIEIGDLEVAASELTAEAYSAAATNAKFCFKDMAHTCMWAPHDTGQCGPAPYGPGPICPGLFGPVHAGMCVGPHMSP
jgi:hypothetical protein